MPNVTISKKNEGDYAIGLTDESYRLAASWDNDYSDYFLVDVRTGKSRELLHRAEVGLSFSPNAKYISGFDSNTKQYFVIDPASLKRTVLKVPANLYNELQDTPSTPSPYGEEGWTKNDDRLLIYVDAFDIWSLDPSQARTRL